MKTKDSQDEIGSFIVGYKGNLYEIDDDGQVGQLTDNISSVGCGHQIALGAMYALDHLYPAERIKKALEITTYLNAGVRPPFVVEEM
jgi:ATP-dependent protease HslVU (ClpYQ) peptidase subunit